MSRKKTPDGVVSVLKFGSGLISFFTVVLAAVLILYSGYVLYDSLAIEVSALSSNRDLLKYKPSVLGQANGDQPSLQEINKDYRAWITVKDNPIDYPVVQGQDNLYYASHDVYGKMSLSGAIYLASENDGSFADSYNLLYGHHMDNEAMFGSLDKWFTDKTYAQADMNYYRSHQTATITAKDGKVYDVTFFALAVTDAYENQIYRVGDRAKEVKDFLSGDRSHDEGLGTRVLIYDRAIASTATKVVALSTCASANTNGRIVLFGRMVKHGANPTPGGHVTLVVKFHDPDGKEVFPDQTFIHQEGDQYYVVAPQKPGYYVSIRIVKGTITEDMEVIVIYTPMEWTLTVRFRLMDGTEIYPTYVQTIHTDEAYLVECPKIEGYRATRLRIAGVNPGRDECYTVIYVPEDFTEFATIDDFRTPMNMGESYLQVGVAAE